MKIRCCEPLQVINFSVSFVYVTENGCLTLKDSIIKILFGFAFFQTSLPLLRDLQKFTFPCGALENIEFHAEKFHKFFLENGYVT